MTREVGYITKNGNRVKITKYKDEYYVYVNGHSVTKDAIGLTSMTHKLTIRYVDGGGEELNIRTPIVSKMTKVFKYSDVLRGLYDWYFKSESLYYNLITNNAMLVLNRTQIRSLTLHCKDIELYCNKLSEFKKNKEYWSILDNAERLFDKYRKKQ